MDVCLLYLYVVLSCVGKGLCDKLISGPKEYYRVSNNIIETPERRSWPDQGWSAIGEKNTWGHCSKWPNWRAATALTHWIRGKVGVTSGLKALKKGRKEKASVPAGYRPAVVLFVV
jgi:hypothetical protein